MFVQRMKEKVNEIEKVNESNTRMRVIQHMVSRFLAIIGLLTLKAQYGTITAIQSIQYFLASLMH